MTSVAEISQRLARQVLSVCLLLLPGGKEKGGEYVCGSVSGGEGESLKVHLNGQHAGSWKDWASPDHHGDLLDLWEISRGVTKGEAITQAKLYLGIHDADIGPKKHKTYAKPPKKDLTAPTAGGRSQKWLTDTRKLTPETIAAFKIEVDAESRSIVFPSYSPKGELVNRSYRTLPKSPADKKKVWQDTGCAPCIWGWQALPRSAYDTRTVLLCEGQIDCATWWQWGIPALSIPNGSGGTWIDYEWENLQAFDTILLACDTDQAGKEIADKTAKRLGIHRCKIISLPHKDANAALQAGATKEDAQEWVKAAQIPSLSGILAGSELKARTLASLGPQERPWTFEGLDKGGSDGLFFRPGEVTLWTGAYGNGKSTFLDFVIIHLLESSMPCYVCSLERRATITVRRQASAFAAKLGFYKMKSGMFRSSQGEHHESAIVEGFLDGCGENLVMSDKLGQIKIDDLFEQMRYSFRRYGCQHFFIDSLMRIDGLTEDYPAQLAFMNRLQEFAKKESDGHIHLVAHPRKTDPNGAPSGLDIKGSSDIPNNADNVVSIVRNQEKKKAMDEGDADRDELDKMHDTMIVVDKQRETGWCHSLYFKFNPDDFTFKPCERYKPAPKQPQFRKRAW